MTGQLRGLVHFDIQEPAYHHIIVKQLWIIIIEEVAKYKIKNKI